MPETITATLMRGSVGVRYTDEALTALAGARVRWTPGGPEVGTIRRAWAEDDGRDVLAEVAMDEGAPSLGTVEPSIHGERF